MNTHQIVAVAAEGIKHEFPAGYHYNEETIKYHIHTAIEKATETLKENIRLLHEKHQALVSENVVLRRRAAHASDQLTRAEVKDYVFRLAEELDDETRKQVAHASEPDESCDSTWLFVYSSHSRRSTRERGYEMKRRKIVHVCGMCKAEFSKRSECWQHMDICPERQAAIEKATDKLQSTLAAKNLLIKQLEQDCEAKERRLEESHAAQASECKTNPISSRICERGTKTCTIYHNTALASESPESAYHRGYDAGWEAHKERAALASEWLQAHSEEVSEMTEEQQLAYYRAAHGTSAVADASEQKRTHCPSCGQIIPLQSELVAQTSEVNRLKP